MVPIHDTDLEDMRWSHGEWENYELWEKVEARLKRKKRLWILLTCTMVLFFSAVPTIIECWPKWKTRSMIRILAQEINHIKRNALINKCGYLIRPLAGNQLEGLFFNVEKVTDCGVSVGEVVQTGMIHTHSRLASFFDFFFGSDFGSFQWLWSSRAQELGIPGVVDVFCYDYLYGSADFLAGKPIIAFGMLPVKDLSKDKIDRLSLLLLSGPFAEASF